MSDTSLYDTDYVAWTEAQASALRAHGRGSNTIDYELLAEEIEDMGRSETHACESLTRQILIHFAEIAFIGTPQDVPHWAGEIIGFRASLAVKLTPSIRARLPGLLADVWANARKQVMVTYALPRHDASIPQDCPYTLEDVLGRGEDWLPTPPETP